MSTWSQFKANVRLLCPVDANRFGVGTGATNYLDQLIKQAVIDIQNFVPFYRSGNETIYMPDDLVEDGLASVGELPDGAYPIEAFYVKTGSTCVRQPLWSYDYGSRYDLVCGNPRIINCQFAIAIDDRQSRNFYVFPKVEEGREVSLFWDGVKTDYADSETVPFDEQVELAVSLFVKAAITREVDKDLAMAASYVGNPQTPGSYMNLRTNLYRNSQEKKRLRANGDSPQPSAKCGTSMSCSGTEAITEDVTEFAAFGSSGEDAGIANTAAVANLVKGLEPDFIMHMGNTNYPAGDPVGIQDHLVKYYSGYIPDNFYLSFGPVDLASSDGAAALMTLLTAVAEANSGEKYYQIIKGPVALFVLNSGKDDNTGIPAAQDAWLQTQLAASDLWNIVVFNRAPYTSDSVLTPGAAVMRKSFKTWGAHIVLSASGLNYERLLVDGFPYINCGLGGATKRGFVSPAISGSQFRYNDFYGALWVTANSTRLQLSLYNTKGDVVDSLTLHKDA